MLAEPRGRAAALSPGGPSAGPALRIAHLSATFPPYLGGAGTTCLHLAAGLAARGHHVEVFTARAEGPAPDAGRAIVHRLEPVAAIGNAPLLPSLARLSGFDVVHLHYPFIFGSELVLAGRVRSRTRALVVSYHNRLIGEGGRRPLFAAYESTVAPLVARTADRICVLSDAHAATVPYLRSRPPGKLAVLPNGVDVHAFRPGPDAAGVRAEHGIPSDAPVAAFVAALDRAHFSKRLDLALEAVSLARRPDVHLLVAGGGEWLERYRAEAAVCGIAGRVHFLGSVAHERLPDVLRAADLLLLTSDLESFGIVLLEAMACGLPTVSTDPPGVGAVVRPGETGLMAPRGDARAIARALDELIERGPEGRAPMGLAGRAECERRYTWPRLAERLEEVYREVLASSSGSGTSDHSNAGRATPSSRSSKPAGAAPWAA
jgi:glycosyltransferase involved in cell wall biosynthesis